MNRAAPSGSGWRDEMRRVRRFGALALAAGVAALATASTAAAATGKLT